MVINESSVDCLYLRHRCLLFNLIAQYKPKYREIIKHSNNTKCKYKSLLKNYFILKHEFLQ